MSRKLRPKKQNGYPLILSSLHPESCSKSSGCFPSRYHSSKLVDFSKASFLSSFVCTLSALYLGAVSSSADWHGKIVAA